MTNKIGLTPPRPSTPLVGRRTAVVLVVAVAVVIGTAILAATGSFDAPRFRLVGLTEAPAAQSPAGPGAPGYGSGCARRATCTVTAVFENTGESRPAIAIFTAHTHSATDAQGNFQPAGPDAHCSVPLPASTPGQSVEVSCILEAVAGSPITVLDSPVTVSLQ